MSKVVDFSDHSDDKDRIKEMARRYFSRNPRLVKSFVRDLAFLMAVIKPRYDYLLALENPTPEIEQEKKNLKEISQSPGLLAKIIVIRERFPKEFIDIQRDPTIISRLEDNPGLDMPQFNNEIKTFIASSWPLFKSRNANPANFILLGGSSGTEFHEEIDVGQFINYANAGDIENFYTSISKSPLYKRAEYLTSVINAYDSAPDDPTKANIAKSVIVALHLVENVSDRNNLLNSVIPWVEKDNGVIFNQLSSEQIKRWIRSLNKTNIENDQLSKIMSETPYGNSDSDTRNRFWEAFTLSNLSESMIGKFANFFSSLLSSFGEKQLLLDLLGRSEFLNRITRNPELINVGNNIINFCITQPYSDEKIKAMNLLGQIDADDNSKKQLIEHLLNWAISTEENQKNFAKEHLLKSNLWPTDQGTLMNTVQGFKTFYKTLDQNEQNHYQGLVTFFKGKEVWNGKRKRKTNTK